MDFGGIVYSEKGSEAGGSGDRGERFKARFDYLSGMLWIGGSISNPRADARSGTPGCDAVSVRIT